MKRHIQELVEKEYDLVIVGGGIFGVCAAWDAALRGLSVAIVEKNDFCHATSANHLKMVHGGIRYLQHADLCRIRESSRERSALLHIAPHLVRPLPIVIPTYGHGIKGKEFLRVGFVVYDLLTLDRNFGISDPKRRIPRGHFISRREILQLFPDLCENGLTGGAVFFDGQMYNPPRLAMSFLRSAVGAGAEAANYLEVTRFLKKENRVIGVVARDILAGDQLEIRSKAVLNTAGAWSHLLLEKTLGIQLDPKPIYSRDLAFVIPRKLSNNYGFATPLKTKDADAVLDRGGRHIFVAPWRCSTLIGVWHVVFNRIPEEVSVTEEELQGFIDEVNEACPGFALKLKDVSMILTGLTLFGEESKQETTKISFGKRSRLIDHKKEHNIEGLVTLMGVRATTARGKAERAIDLIFEKIENRITKSKTSVTPIYGGQIDCFDDFLNRAIEKGPSSLSSKEMRPLVHNYGSKYQEVLKYIKENPVWVENVGDSTVIKAEIIHAVREEMAQKLADVVFRRTDLGTGGDPGGEALRTCAELIAEELGWDDEKTQAELEEVSVTFQRLGFLKNGRSLIKAEHVRVC
ncbi:MAG: FAD-dependent oxidoreductase [Candidatus Scalinduaceae bacterium]